MHVNPVFAVVTIFATGACAPDRAAPAGESATPVPRLPAAVFESVRRISLQETEEVVNVSPSVFVQEGGRGFFLVDRQEAQARFYRFDGSLVRQFGRRGKGPGEFQQPVTGYQVASGHTVVGDLANGLLVFDERDSLVSSARPPLTPLYWMGPISDTLAYLLGRPSAWQGEAGAPLVHVWNLNRRRIERSFFPTPGSDVIREASRNFGWAGAGQRGDTLAVVSALVDTMYFLGADGSLLRKLPLPIRGFSPIASLPYDELSDPVRRDAWLRRFYFLHSVHWLADGSLLVQYERPDGRQSRWNLLRVDHEGRRIFDLKDTPRLLAVRDEQLYFLDPGSETPNEWLVARLKD